MVGGPLDDPRVQRALDLLNPDGEETRLVGGVVRNVLLGCPWGDIDLATTLRPEAVRALAKRAKLRSIPTGIAHGTVTLLVEGLPLEVTTLREDVETDGRHAVVRFGRDFEVDALRRDFTINALSADRHGRIFDYAGGLEDLAAKRVRFIGDPERRIREDFLRILRFFRFHATYGEGPPDAEGLAAAVAQRAGLARLSRERIRSELLKILVAPGVIAAVDAMQAARILEPLLGRSAEPERLRRIAVLARSDDPLLNLAALALHEDGDVEGLREALRLSNAETVQLESALRARRAIGVHSKPPDRAALRRLVFEHGPGAVSDGLRLAYADGPTGNADVWRQTLETISETKLPALPVSGADLLARGLAGPAVGAALARFKAAWAEAGFPTEPSAVRALLDKAAADTARGQVAS